MVRRMNILRQIKNKHKQKIRNKLLADLEFFFSGEWNDGLAKGRLMSMWGVRGYCYETGGYAFLTVTMSDRYEVFVSGVFFEDTMKKAIKGVVERVCEVNGLEEINLDNIIDTT